MLTRHPADTTATTIWYDLLDPTADEISTVEAATGLTVPRRDALVEIETSSRLRLVADVLYLSTPMVWRGPAPATTARRAGRRWATLAMSTRMATCISPIARHS